MTRRASITLLIGLAAALPVSAWGREKPSLLVLPPTVSAAGGRAIPSSSDPQGILETLPDLWTELAVSEVRKTGAYNVLNSTAVPQTQPGVARRPRVLPPLDPVKAGAAVDAQYVLAETITPILGRGNGIIAILIGLRLIETSSGKAIFSTEHRRELSPAPPGADRKQALRQAVQPSAKQLALQLANALK